MRNLRFQANLAAVPANQGRYILEFVVFAAPGLLVIDGFILQCAGPAKRWDRIKVEPLLALNIMDFSKDRRRVQRIDSAPRTLTYCTATLMKRRTLLRWLTAASGTLPFPALRAWSQTASFPGKHASTLRALAKIVLPSELGPAGTDRVAGQFELWVRDYRPGADTDHGYGFTRVRAKPPSPAPTYLAQLEALHQPLDRRSVEAEIERANIRDLPHSPDGKHVIADLMSFYFHGSDANDLCYRAAIHRYECRGLDGSDNPPPSLKGAA